MVTPLDNLKKYEIRLASASPRRRELLTMLGIDFTLLTGVDVDETYPASLPAVEVPEFLAVKKSEAYRQLIDDRTLCITADTVVIIDNEVIGKPHSEEEARAMIRRLSGRTHIVATGVAVATALRRESFTVTTEVSFAPLSESEISYYVERFRPLDKAGAYGIQEWIGCAGIRSINGSFYNVMGLPVQRLYEVLKSF